MEITGAGDLTRPEVLGLAGLGLANLGLAGGTGVLDPSDGEGERDTNGAAPATADQWKPPDTVVGERRDTARGDATAAGEVSEVADASLIGEVALSPAGTVTDLTTVVALETAPSDLFGNGSCQDAANDRRLSNGDTLRFFPGSGSTGGGGIPRILPLLDSVRLAPAQHHICSCPHAGHTLQL